MKPTFLMTNATFQTYIVDQDYNEWRVGGSCCAEHHNGSYDEMPYWSDLVVGLIEFVRNKPGERIERIFIRTLEELPGRFKESARKQIEVAAMAVLESDYEESQKFEGCAYDNDPRNQEQ